MPSDEEAIAYGIERANAEDRPIDDATARAIAALRHGSAWPAYTALSTTGAIEEGLAAEILEDVHKKSTEPDVYEWLCELTIYRLHLGPRGPVEGWSRIWPEEPPADWPTPDGYGRCIVCGEDMAAGSEPHTYEDDPERLQEVHPECCPTCKEPG